ncbi:MAG: hypothetical protein PHI34_04535 [Acidobacteriota bacterium]|nr:hypothetical protein [Acidobacteriota bacterium]
MTDKTVQKLVQGWETVRYELLNTRIADLGLHAEGSPVDKPVQRLYREIEAKKIRFRPRVYLTDGWGCPDRSPVIGIPFYLADRRLARIEEEQTGEIEDERGIMMYLRHEAGHAINYAYRLWKRPGWVETFGAFNRPYRDIFRPDRASREFVRHIEAYPYGRTYAQKHPDEDFAETFAVWLKPRGEWRRRYRYWPALRKLVFVDGLMRSIREEYPGAGRGRTFKPVERMTYPLADHYGKKAERLRRVALGYVDDRLREVFPPVRGDVLRPAYSLFRKHPDKLTWRVMRWSNLSQASAETILRKLESRCRILGLSFRPGRAEEKFLDVVSLATALAMDYAYTGRLTG